MLEVLNMAPKGKFGMHSTSNTSHHIVPALCHITVLLLGNTATDSGEWRQTVARNARFWYQWS